MKTETREVKSKGQVVATYEYSYPENLSEALDTDGEDKVFAFYARQRVIRHDDNERAKATTSAPKLSKELIAAIKNADPEVLARIAAEVGLDLN